MRSGMEQAFYEYKKSFMQAGSTFKKFIRAVYLQGCKIQMPPVYFHIDRPNNRCSNMKHNIAHKCVFVIPIFTIFELNQLRPHTITAGGLGA